MNKNVVLLAGVLLLAFIALRPKPVQYYPPITGNTNRDNKVSDILQWVAVAGATIAQIQQLIATINNSSDSTVQAMYDNVRRNESPYSGLA